MRTATLLACLLSFGPAAAQITAAGVHDVGLVMTTPTVLASTQAVGQACGPFTCTPFSAPSPAATPASSTRTVRIFGDANSLWVLMMSTTPPASTPCLPIPGIGNALILGQPIVVVGFGVTGPLLPNPTAACQQGVGTFQLTLPTPAPNILPFYLQALTMSHATGGPAFTVAVRGFAH
jgi:hypothetical protein